MESSMPTVIIVDDYIMNLKVAEFALKSNFNVLLAKSGEEALKILETNEVDLILLDIMMPEMDGFETYEKIREMDSCKETPVCFLTGDADESAKNKMAELKAPFIEKPFVPADLNEMINSLLQ